MGLEALFYPERVLLVGSSTIREEIGMASPALFESIAHNLRSFFKGEFEAFDVKSPENIRELRRLGKTFDLVLLALPPDLSLSALKESVELGIEAAVGITGGYSDEQREEIRRVCEEHGVRFLGPNTIMGIINTDNGLNTTFEKNLMPEKGGISVISQSGGVGACLLDWACYQGVGLSKVAFVGDKVDVDDADLLEFFLEDEQTKVVCAYVEGVSEGRKYLEAAKKFTEEKPLVVLKGGIIEESARRALSHTASLAGSFEVFKAALKKAGAFLVEDLRDLFDASVALEKQPRLKGNRIAIVSNVGGPAILMADALAREGFSLPQLSEETRRELLRLYPKIDPTNPIDLIADARADRFKKSLDIVASDPNVDGIIAITMLKSCYLEPEDVRALVEFSEEHPEMPILNLTPGGEDFALIKEQLKDSRVPVYDSPSRVVSALKALRYWHQRKAA